MHAIQYYAVVKCLCTVSVDWTSCGHIMSTACDHRFLFADNFIMGRYKADNVNYQCVNRCLVGDDFRLGRRRASAVSMATLKFYF